MEYVEAIYEEGYKDQAFEYESMMVVNNIHYEISSLHVTTDYITYPLEIKPLSERDCMIWIVKNRKGNIGK